jgi:multiple sugar transport system permease protein
MTGHSTKEMTWRRALAIYPLALLLVVFTLFPIYWVTNSSLKLGSEVFHFPPIYWPSKINLQNYVSAITNSRLASFYVNSLIVAFCTCICILLLVIFAGYSMSRFGFRGKGLVVLLFLLAQMLPAVVLIAPLFAIYSKLHLINTRWGLIISYTIGSLPFCVLMMRGFFDSLPQEMEEAAMVDGCGRTGALFRVLLPMALPGLVATSIFGFIDAWNELIFAVMFISSPNLQTLPVGLSLLRLEWRTDYGLMLAVAVLALVPSLILFGFIQRFLTTGLSAGAVKG